MATMRTRGFTIIEVVLFVTISGTLAVLLATGWTGMLNTQRYRDSVNTFQSYIQQQYNLVYNVENAREGNDKKCVKNGISGAPQVQSVAGDYRGKADCVLLGRYIFIDGGKTATSYPIMGVEPDSPTASTTEAAVIGDYNPRVVTSGLADLNISESSMTLPWDATIVDPGTTDSRTIGIAIIRSPQTGIAHTYTKAETVLSENPFGTLVNDANENEQRLCIDPGAILAGGNRAVVFRASASSQSSIESEQDSTC